MKRNGRNTVDWPLNGRQENEAMSQPNSELPTAHLRVDRKIVDKVLRAVLILAICFVGSELRSLRNEVTKIRTELDVVKPAEVMTKVHEIDNKLTRGLAQIAEFQRLQRRREK